MELKIEGLKLYEEYFSYLQSDRRYLRAVMTPDGLWRYISANIHKRGSLSEIPESELNKIYAKAMTPPHGGHGRGYSFFYLLLLERRKKGSHGAKIGSSGYWGCCNSNLFPSLAR